MFLPDPLTPEAIEQVRRSIVMLTPGQPGLDREAALTLIAELQRHQGADRRLSELVESLRALLGAAEG